MDITMNTNELSTNKAIDHAALLKAITYSKHQSSSSLSYLRNIKLIADELQLALAAQPTGMGRSTYVTMKKQLALHVRNIDKRIEYISRRNADSYSKQKQRLRTADLLTVVALAAPQLIKENEQLRSTKLVADKQEKATAQKALAKPVFEDLTKAGFPFHGTPEEIQEWQQKYKDAQNQKGTNEEYEAIIARMQDLTTNEPKKESEPKKEIAPGIKSIDTGDKLGSPEDWL